MKVNQIKCAALAAAILAGVGMAYGGESSLQVVYCKATIVGESSEQMVSVTLPPTEGYYDNYGNPLTFWNVGNVPSCGVADSWHGEGGPGRFTAHNDGTLGAYMYITTKGGNAAEYIGFYSDGDRLRHLDTFYVYFDSQNQVFGSGSWLPMTCVSVKQWRSSEQQYHYGNAYHLAFTTDATAKVPTWHSLDHRLQSSDGSSSNTTYYWSPAEEEDRYNALPDSNEVAGYMGYVEAGDYLTFDLKFWAPYNSSSQQPVFFTFCVEASTFPLWDHSRAVE